jgi:hypothetical protein
MLEARKETRGRFRTNQRVAKVMGRGSHEIGLIAEDVRLVIKIDGEQHRTLTQTRRAASVRDYCSGKRRIFAPTLTFRYPRIAVAAFGVHLILRNTDFGG